MPLSEIGEDIPAMFRRAAINAALGSARSFYGNLARWRKHKEKAESRGKQFTERPPVPPRTWNKSATLYAGMQVCRHVERADGIKYPHQGLDRNLLELDTRSHHWTGNSRWGRSWESSTCA
jgi:hypothetical protein